MAPIDLQFQNVSKRYWVDPRQEIVTQPPGLWRRIVAKWNPPRAEFWALRDVDFAIERGQAVGIIGHNGAGKSTILKLLSSITAPTRGQIEIHGRLVGLLEVGSGFHPDLTGRENIFLSGSILGMRRADIARKLESIVEFAEIASFIDVPAKRYSSGMYVRLGFSIAAHLEPEILLLDEVLAVGDAAFQRKCLARVAEMRNTGITTVFISHDLVAVRELCPRVLLMQRGQLIGDGPATDIIGKYQRMAAAPMGGDQIESPEGRKAQIAGITLLDDSGAAGSCFQTGHRLRVRLRYEAAEPLSGIQFHVFFRGLDNRTFCQFTTGEPYLNVEAGPGEIEFETDALPLAPDLYIVDAAIEQYRALASLDYRYACRTVQISPGREFKGAFYLPQRWRRVENGASLPR
ncbi:MAG: ABC transporter ATP-binding protein [Acidobacteriota bacterium]